MSGAGFMRLVKGLGDAVKSAASKKTEADQVSLVPYFLFVM